MLRNMFNAIVDLVYASIQYPQDLPNLVSHMNTRVQYLFALMVFPALSSATGLYYMRDFYASYYVIEIAILFVVHFLFLGLWGMVFGSSLNSLVIFLRPGRESRAWSSIGITILSATPLGFIMPMAIPARMLPYSEVIFLIGFILLSIWSISIVIRSTRYLFELTYPDTFKAAIGATVISGLFPFAFFIFFVVEFLEITG